MVSTIIRFFFCLSFVVVTASNHKLDGEDKPALTLEGTVTRTSPIPPAADADVPQAHPLITSDIAPIDIVTIDIVTILLELSQFTLAYPFALVNRECFDVVCGACFRKLQSLPISPSIPTSKAILTFASQYLNFYGTNLSPEITADTSLRLIVGTDNQHIIMQASTIISQLEFPESKRQDAISACNFLQSKLKPGERSHAFGIDTLRIKFGGFVGFYNVVIAEIIHRIRCTQDDKFCRPEHVNRSKNVFFGNIRVFYPEYFEKMHEEIIIMDSLPILKESTVSFLPFYQEIMGGPIMVTPVLTLDSIFEKIKADGCDMFWEMCLLQLAVLPKWGEVNALSHIAQDPILTEHFYKITEILRAFASPAGFSIKSLSEPKKNYVFTCLFAHLNLRVDATDGKAKMIAIKTFFANDLETSIFLIKMLQSAGHYKAVFDAIDDIFADFDLQFCALELVKNLGGRVLTDYLSDRRANHQSPLLLRRIAVNLNQIIMGDVFMAERYNVILEYAASQDISSARQMAHMIIYTAAITVILRTEENLSKIVEKLSKKGNWVKDAFKAFNWNRK